MIALGAALQFAKLIPWKVWAILGVALTLAVLFLTWLHDHDKAIKDKDAQHEVAAVKAVTDDYETRLSKTKAAYDLAVAKLQEQLAAAQRNAQVAAAQAARELAAERARHEALKAELDKQRSINVTSEADHLCPVLTVGVVRQFNADAAGANGDDPSDVGGTAGPGPESANAASGVALSAYSRTVGEVEAALGKCRSQVIGWQNYHAKVLRPWLDATRLAIQSCIPKGAP